MTGEQRASGANVTGEQHTSGADVTREQHVSEKILFLLPNCYILLTWASPLMLVFSLGHLRP